MVIQLVVGITVLKSKSGNLIPAFYKTKKMIKVNITVSILIFILFSILTVYSQDNSKYELSEYFISKKKVNKILGIKSFFFPKTIDKSLKKLDSLTISRFDNWDYFFISKIASKAKKYQISFDYFTKIRGGNFDITDTLKNDLFIQYFKSDKTFLKFKNNKKTLYEKALDSLTKKVNNIKSKPYFDSLYYYFYYDQLYRTRVNVELNKKVRDIKKIQKIDSLMRITDRKSEQYVYNLCEKYGYLGWDNTGSILDVMLMHHGNYWYYYLEKMKEAAKLNNADWGRFDMLQKRAFLFKSETINPNFQFEEFYYTVSKAENNFVMQDVFNFLKEVCKKKNILLTMHVEDINSKLNIIRYSNLKKTFKNEINKKQIEVIINSNINGIKLDDNLIPIDNIITVQLQK